MSSQTVSVFKRLAASADEAVAGWVSELEKLVAEGHVVKGSRSEKSFLEYQQRITSLRDVRTRLREELGKEGLEPLAILPSSAWSAVCQKHNLFHFENARDGRVPFSAESVSRVVQYISMQIVIIGFWAFALTCFALMTGSGPSQALGAFGVLFGGYLAALTLRVAYEHFSLPYWCSHVGIFMSLGAPVCAQQLLIGSPGMHVIGTVLNLVFSVIAWVMLFWIAHEGFRGWPSVLRLLPQRLYVDVLWPTRNDTLIGSEDKTVLVAFPQTSEAFAEKRRELSSRQRVPCIATEPGGILLGDEVSDRVRTKRLAKQAHTQWCSVLYTRCSMEGYNLVAIIDQSGDFPREERFEQTLSELNFRTCTISH